MSLRRSEGLALSFTFAAFIVSFFLYPDLPEKVASHWNIEGLVNGYTSRFWGAFLIPTVSLFMFLVLTFIPRIDPRKSNIEKFRKQFDWFIIALFLFFFYLHLLTLAWNLGIHFNFTQFLLPALSTLFYIVGVVTEKAEPNWTVGIRTPWTLSNEKVWKKTHTLGGKLFKTTAFVSLLGFFAGSQAFWFFLLPALFPPVCSIIYSYFAFKKEKNV